MIIHPAVTSKLGTINDTPIISTREVETKILLEDNQTVVIGGLLKDIKKKGSIGIPFLKDIPLLGAIFSRDTKDVEKIDLLIFITASIVKTDSENYDLMKCHRIEQEIIYDRLQRKRR